MLRVATFDLGQGKDKYCTGYGPVPNRLPVITVISMSTRFHDKTRAGPRTLECGGASGPDPEQSNTGYDVSGVSRKGESMRGGLGGDIGGPGEIPREKFGKLWCRRSVF